MAGAPVLVLYEIVGEGGATEVLNAFEVPSHVFFESGREVLLADLIEFIRSSPVLSAALLTRGYTFSALSRDGYEHLPSLASILPVCKDGTVRLRLSPAFTPPITPSSESQFSAFLWSARLSANQDSARRQPPPSSTRPTDFVSRQAPAFHAGDDSSSSVLVEATEQAKIVAKEAAKSLFSFAASVGKSVFDMASYSSQVNLSTTTSWSTGSSFQIGHSKMVIQRQIAEGGFGMVYSAVLESSSNPEVMARFAGRGLAVKQLLCQSKEQIDEAHHEIDVLRLLQGHDGIIPLVDHCSIEVSGAGSILRQVVLAFPLYPLGTAWDSIARVLYTHPPAHPDVVFNPALWPFPERKILYIGYHVTQALAFMHSQGVSHRDVKPHNILLSDPETADELRLGCGLPVLMDLGSAAPVRQSLTTKRQALDCEDEAARKTSLAYRAPELVAVPPTPCVITEAVDVWALGCTLYALAYGRSPFESPKEGVQKLGILNGRVVFAQAPKGRDYSEDFKQLVVRMLQVDPAQRSSLHDVAKTLKRLLLAYRD